MTTLVTITTVLILVAALVTIAAAFKAALDAVERGGWRAMRARDASLRPEVRGHLRRFSLGMAGATASFGLQAVIPRAVT